MDSDDRLLRNVLPEGGGMTSLSNEATALMSKLLETIEDRLFRAAGTGFDLAVTETWEGTTLTLHFELVDPHGPFPPSCTVYRTSQLKTGRT